MCDNSSAVSISKNPVFHGRTKHIKIKFHFIREVQQSNEVLLVHCSSENQLADIFTKSLPKERFEDLWQRIGVCHKNAKEECQKICIFSSYYHFFTVLLILVQCFLFSSQTQSTLVAQLSEVSGPIMAVSGPLLWQLVAHVLILFFQISFLSIFVLTVASEPLVVLTEQKKF